MRELSEIAVGKLPLFPPPYDLERLQHIHHAAWVPANIDAVACDYRGLEAIFERCISVPRSSVNCLYCATAIAGNLTRQ